MPTNKPATSSIKSKLLNLRCFSFRIITSTALKKCTGVEEGDAPNHSGGFGVTEPHHSRANLVYSMNCIGKIYAQTGIILPDFKAFGTQNQPIGI
jgi:hypothetical protein